MIKMVFMCKLSTITIILLLVKFSVSQWVFPENFKFGVATSAYQIEGAWNVDGKGESVWDRLTHTNPGLVANNSNGDIACRSYDKWEEDIEMVKATGVDFYRFSLSWTRLFPTGTVNIENPLGVAYYNKLIDGLLANGIQPVVTLYHWDYPVQFSPLGSWTNPDIVQLFADYSRRSYELFGDRVKTWITFNEPKVFCQDFNEYLGTVQPNYPTGIIEYLCTHNVLKSHAEAYHIYDREFRAEQKGRVSITLNFEWAEPANVSNPNDVAAAEQRRQFEFGIYAHPIILLDYPAIVKERIAERSREQNFPQSRLPQFTLQEKLRIKGTYDYLGLNHYSTWYVTSSEEDIDVITYAADMGTTRFQDDSWPSSGAAWNYVVPWGLRSILKWIKDSYYNVEVLITECGYPEKNIGEIDDQLRIEFFQGYLNATLQAIHEDGSNVQGFTAWSLMDNFEWQQGYNIKFGLYHVDFNDPERKRTAKSSVGYIKKVVETRNIDIE